MRWTGCGPGSCANSSRYDWQGKEPTFTATNAFRYGIGCRSPATAHEIWTIRSMNSGSVLMNSSDGKPPDNTNMCNRIVCHMALILVRVADDLADVP